MQGQKETTTTWAVKKHRYSEEILVHYQCWHCNRWWTIGDDHNAGSQERCCPWCGTISEAEPCELAEDIVEVVTSGSQ